MGTLPLLRKLSLTPPSFGNNLLTSIPSTSKVSNLAFSLFPRSMFRNFFCEVAKPPIISNKGQNPPLLSFPAGLSPLSSIFPNFKTRDHGTFKNEHKWLTGEILLGLFEELSYNKFYLIKADDRTKLSDLCMFEIYDSIVGCCGKFSRIISKATVLI